MRRKGLLVRGRTGSEIGQLASDACPGEDLMAKSAQKATLSPSRDIPIGKHVLRQCNVRSIKAGNSVEDLAEDIAPCGLLQNLSVRPVLAEDRSKTGNFEIPPGDRRFLALSHLVKETPIPCIVRDANFAIHAKNDSLAKGMQPGPCIRSIRSAPSWRGAARVRR